MPDLFKMVGVIVVGLPVLIAVIVVSAIFNGWAIHLLWNWFYPPIFGLPFLTIGQAIGLSLVVSVCKGSPQGSKELEDDSKYLTRSIVGPLLAVLMGYFVQTTIF